MFWEEEAQAKTLKLVGLTPTLRVVAVVLPLLAALAVAVLMGVQVTLAHKDQAAAAEPVIRLLRMTTVVAVVVAVAGTAVAAAALTQREMTTVAVAVALATIILLWWPLYPVNLVAAVVEAPIPVSVAPSNLPELNKAK